MSKTTASLNELIDVLNDGASFYREAAESVEDGTYENLFRRMAASKQEICTDLKAEVSARGDTPATGGTVLGSLRQVYTDMRAGLSDKPEKRFVSQLEESEDRIVEAFREAVYESDRPEVRAIAQKHMPTVNRMHQEMSSLKHRLQAQS
ncbi:MAG TPA: PA2169 family four-helix-bundle protein [Xanthomonadaceae bacterium]|nr:PA2169 family four-helix-bundle protein [Xanthomonadaceae bacterium]